MYPKLILTLTCCLTVASGAVMAAEKSTRSNKSQPRREKSAAKANFPTLPDRSQLPAFLPPANEPGPDYHHASTLEQGYLDGLARLLRAEGITAYNYALAAVVTEHARDAWLRNQTLALDVRHLNRVKHREYRRIMRGPPLTQEQLAEIARRRAPKELSMQRIDWQDGKIEWPADLRSKRFDADRKQLEKLFLESAARGYALPYAEIKQTTERMRDTLREQIELLPTERYLAAKSFLTGLTQSARKGVTTVQLAQSL